MNKQALVATASFVLSVCAGRLAAASSVTASEYAHTYVDHRFTCNNGGSLWFVGNNDDTHAYLSNVRVTDSSGGGDQVSNREVHVPAGGKTELGCDRYPENPSLTRRYVLIGEKLE